MSSGKYQVIRKLADGGMAEIFLAHEVGGYGKRRRVAIKQMAPRFRQDDEYMEMFRTEAKIGSLIRHPNVVRIIDGSRVDDRSYFVMEYVHGTTFLRLLRAAFQCSVLLPTDVVVSVLMRAANGLHHAHEQHDERGAPMHIVHRDVSPSNILLGYDGSVKVADFGVAKTAASPDITCADIVKGKLGYMSPEQCRGRALDCRSDIFAMGILLFEATTGRRLFHSDNSYDVLHTTITQDSPMPTRVLPGYDPHLERIVMRCLARERDARYSTAAELRRELAALAERRGLDISARRLARFIPRMFAMADRRATAPFESVVLTSARTTRYEPRAAA
jgi:serine/threonine protein kinase